MRKNVLARVRQIMAERDVGLLEAKRAALAESAEWTAQNALDELEILLGKDVAHWIDELVKARVARYPQ